MKTLRPKPPVPPRKKRVLIVDDHPLMREGIANWINRAPDLEACCQADSAAAAMRVVEKMRPDIVVTDLSLPKRNGFELIRDIRALRPDLPVLVLSMHSESLYAERALRAGASGYLMKGEGGEKLLTAIRHILAGGVEVNEQVVQQILGTLTAHRPTGSRSPIERLTDRELEIFELIGRGSDSSTIAESLCLSRKTVNVHQANIRRKLHLTTGTALVHHAVLWLEAEQQESAH